MDPRRKRIAVLRAVMVTVFLVAHGIYALPLPKKISLEDIRKQEGQENVDRWLGWLGSAGLRFEKPWFEERVATISTAIGAGHDLLKFPFKPWMQITSTGQAWALFAVPDRWPVRLEIEIQREGSKAWELAYRRLDPEHDELAEVLRYRRIRGIYDGQIAKPRAAYKNLTRWIARDIFERHPDITQVRVQGVKTHTTLPNEPVDDTRTTVSPRPHRRENHVKQEAGK